MANLGESCAILAEVVLGVPCGIAPPAVPGFYVAADWDSDGVPNDGLSLQALTMSITRGIDPQVGRLMVGSAQIELKNHDGRFSPLRDDSPLYPNVKIGKGIAAWREDSTLAIYRQFTGYIREISLDPAPTARKATFDATDFMEVLRRKIISTPLYRDKRSDELIAAILTLAGWAGDVDLEQGSRTFPFASWEKISALDAIQQVIDSELGIFFIAADGVPTFHARYHRFGVTSPAATFDNSMSGMTYTLNADNIANEVIVTAYSRTIRAVGVLWQLAEIPYFLVVGQTVTFSFEFSDPEGSGTCDGMDVVTPVPFTDFDASNSPSGSGSANSISIISLDLRGAGGTIVLQNISGIAKYIVFFRIRGKAIAKSQISVRKIDQDSIDEYGFTSTLTLDQPLEATTEAAEQAATILLQTNAFAMPQVQITVKPDGDDNIDAIAQLDLNAAVEISQPDIGLDDVLFFIDQITHNVNNIAASQITTYSLSQTPSLDFIILDNPAQTFDDFLGV